jgi:glycosyltransferase involved in cell wall biosynthesis
MRSIRVVLWAPLPPPVGGISRWTVRFREAAPRYGLAVRLIDIATGSERVDERSRFQLGRLWIALRALRELARVLRRERPDVCHVTTSLFWATARDALALVLCRAHRVPAVLQIRASNQTIAWREQLGPIRRRLLDAVLRLPDALLVLACELEEYLRRVLPGQQVVRIGNLVAGDERGRSAGASVVLPERRAPCRVLFVGARLPLKGLGELAEAVRALPDCELVVVGGEGAGAIDPAAQRRMMQALERLRAEGRLVEMGELRPELVTRCYAECDVFALPSHREGFPNTLLEAMAAGLPCVASPVGAVPEMLEDECGVLVPVGDVAGLRRALADLAGDPRRRIRFGERAHRRVEERYSEESIMGEYRTLYLGLRRRAAASGISPV